MKIKNFIVKIASISLSLGFLTGVGISTRNNEVTKVHAATKRCDISADWQAKSSLPTSGGYYYLTADVDVKNGWGVPGNVYLDLNGHWLIHSYNNSGEAAVVVESGDTLNLYDSVGTGGIKSGNAGNVCLKGGTFNLNSGTLTNGGASGKQGGVWLEKGSPVFNMRGGNIKNNLGNGVRLDSGTFNMSGGMISNNGCDDSSENVTVCPSCTFNMTGGSVFGSNNSGKYQIVCAKGTLKINGGYIGSCTNKLGINTSSASVTYTSGRFEPTNTYKPGVSTTTSYTVNLDPQNGGSVTSTTRKWNEKTNLSSVPTKTGYTFDGYYDEIGASERFFTSNGSASVSWPFVGTKTLYAHWTANTYSVTLDKQGATSNGTIGPLTATYNANLSKITPPTKTGYTFAGYYDATSGGTQYIKSDGTAARAWNKTSKATLYARWTANTYTVNYNGNGNTGGSTASSSHSYGTAKTLTSIGFTKTGYTFIGWATSENGDVVYTDQQSVSNLTATANGTVTLYAKWTPNKYGIIFDLQGGDNGTTFVEVTYDAAMTAITAPTKTGYTFGGYYTEENGLGTQYYSSTGTSSRTYDLLTGVTLYAKWTPETYHLSLDSQGGTGGDTTVDATFNSVVPSVNIPTKSGYTFKGYYSELFGKGVQYIDKDGKSTSNVWTTASDNTIYAYWTANQYTVTLSKDGGSNGSSSVIATYGASMPSITLPSKAGYSFAGYFSGANGTGTQYYSSNGSSLINYDISSDTTLYAYWTANSYTVTFDKQNGTSGSDSTSVNFASSMPEIQVPTRVGYTFNGYFDAKTGGSQYYDSYGNSVKSWDKTSNATLYAQWSPMTYSITFDYQGGTPIDEKITSTNVTYGTAYGELPSATKDGFNLVGWYTQKTGGTKITEQTILQGTIYNTLYAHYEVNESYIPTCDNAIGGWTLENGVKKQIVAFGFTFSGGIWPSNDADFGIVAYVAGQEQVEYSNGTVAELIENEGRFYMYLLFDEEAQVTCYAKAFVKFNGEYIYSSLVSATGDINGFEYVI